MPSLQRTGHPASLAWTCRCCLAGLRAESELLFTSKHNHVIAAVGSYVTDPTVDRRRRSFGIPLYPLAAMNLAQFLQEISKDNETCSPEYRSSEQTEKNERLMSYCSCLCGAVSYLHSDFVKHRDIKPENILIDRAGTVILADFSIA